MILPFKTKRTSVSDDRLAAMIKLAQAQVETVPFEYHVDVLAALTELQERRKG